MLGVTALHAAVFTDWRRYAPLLVGLAAIAVTIFHVIVQPLGSSHWPQIFYGVYGAWVALAGMALVLFLIAVSFRYEQLIHSSVGVRTSAGTRGPSLTGFPLTRLALDILFVGVWTVVGWTIFLRWRTNPVALLVALMLVSWEPDNGLLVLTSNGLTDPRVQVAWDTLTFVGYMTWMLFFYHFPSSRFVPQWTCVCAGPG